MIYLKDNQYTQLVKLAKEEKRSLAELIRLAVDSLLKKKERKINYLSIVGIAEGEPGRISENAESYLKELFQKKKE